MAKTTRRLQPFSFPTLPRSKLSLFQSDLSFFALFSFLSSPYISLQTASLTTLSSNFSISFQLLFFRSISLQPFLILYISFQTFSLPSYLTLTFSIIIIALKQYYPLKNDFPSRNVSIPKHTRMLVLFSR